MADSRTTRGSNSPVIGKMLFPSTAIPIRLTASSMKGSSSSITISRSTESANLRIIFSGSGQVIPRRRMDASGNTSLAYWYATPQVMMPSERLPASIGYTGRFQQIQAISRMRCSMTGWRLTALPGTMTYLAGLRGKGFGLEAGAILFTQFHHAGRVADAGGQAQQHRRVEALAQFERRADHVLRLLAVRRLQAGDAPELGEGAVILFVLAGVHGGVVRRDDHQPCLHARSSKRT